jgi:hypothetical protein
MILFDSQDGDAPKLIDILLAVFFGFDLEPDSQP